MIFLAAVVLPVLRQPAYRMLALPLIQATGVRFQWIAWLALAVLVATGMANLGLRGYGWEQVRDGALWQGRFGQVLATKLILIAILLVISAAHDLVIGPRVTAVGQANPDDPEVRRLRRQAAWAGQVMLLLSIVVLVLGVVLARGG